MRIHKFDALDRSRDFSAVGRGCMASEPDISPSWGEPLFPDISDLTINGQPHDTPTNLLRSTFSVAVIAPCDDCWPGRQPSWRRVLMTFLRHLSRPTSLLRPPYTVTATRQPAGRGSAQIRRRFQRFCATTPSCSR